MKKEGARTRKRTRGGGSEDIITASLNGDIDRIKELLASPDTDVNQRDEKDMTALYIAARDGKEDIVRLLLGDSRTDINYYSGMIETPLLAAVSKGHLGVIDLLIADPRIDMMIEGNSKILPYAVKKGDEAMVRHLVKYPKVNINIPFIVGTKFRATPLHIAILVKNEAIAAILLDQSGIDVNIASSGEGVAPITTLEMAIKNNMVDTVARLLERSDIIIVDKLKKMRQKEPIQRMLDNKIYGVNNMVLYNAAIDGNLEEVRRLLGEPSGIDINFVYNGIRTPLAIAAAYAQLGVVQVLLADPRIDVNAATPIHAAVESGDIDVVKALLADPRVDVNKQPYALFRAAEFRQTEIIKELLSHPDINPNVTDAQGNTALHLIANDEIYEGQDEMVSALLDNNKTDITLKNNDGKTPLDLAKDNGNDAIIDLLSEAALPPTEHTVNVEMETISRAASDIVSSTKILSPYEIMIFGTKYRYKWPRLFHADTGKPVKNAAVLAEFKRTHIPQVVPLDNSEVLIFGNKFKYNDDGELYAVDNNKRVTNPIILDTFNTFIIHSSWNTRPISDYYITTIDPDYEMKSIVIPKGTLLYNAFFIESIANKDELVAKMFGDILPLNRKIIRENGEIIISGCLDKLHQKFFYSNPGGSPALKKTTQGIFNACAVFETKRDMTLAVLMSPSKYHRLVQDDDVRPSYIKKCSQLDISDCLCHYYEATNTTPARCRYGFNYDVCLSSDFLNEHELDGHIAMAASDSYESVMQPFANAVSRSPVFADVHQIHNILFSSGRAKDTRKKEGVTITGFPELVIHTFGTDWYSDDSGGMYMFDLSFKDDGFKSLIKLLENVNNSIFESDNDLGLYSPLKLIRVATAKNWFNFVDGTVHPSPLYEKYIANDRDTAIIVRKQPTSLFYANSLYAHQRGDLELSMDPRTGFLFNGDDTAGVIFDDGDDDDEIVEVFLDLCMMPGAGDDGGYLEATAAARDTGYFWPKDSVLPLASGSTEGPATSKGGKRTLRINDINPIQRDTATGQAKRMDKRSDWTSEATGQAKAESEEPTPEDYFLPDEVENLYIEMMKVISQGYARRRQNV